MVNKYRGETEVELAGAKFKLVYDTNAIAELDDMLGQSTISFMAEGDKKIGHKFVRAALYAGMLHDKKLEKGMNLKKVGNLINPENMPDLMQQIIKGLMIAWGQDPDKLDELVENEKDKSGNP